MKKNTNTILLVILLVLLSAFVATKVFRTPSRDRNLDMKVLVADTTQIAVIELSLPGHDDGLVLERKDSAWRVVEGGRSAPAARFTVRNALRNLASMRPERIVTRNEESWKKYDITDSAAVRIIARGRDGASMGDWFIGKESQGATYVRRGNNPTVYAVDGYLRNIYNKSFNDWRDRLFLLLDEKQARKLTFNYPGDSSFVLSRADSGWTVENVAADSAKVARYLNKLRFKELSKFVDEVPAEDPDATLTISLDAGDPVVVRGWKREDAWILNSTVQPDAWFRDSMFVRNLFAGRNDFLVD